MVRPKPTLADQFAELEQPAISDFDPENAEDYVDSDSEASGDDAGSDDGRTHYADVGKSLLRDTALERPLKAAYKGQKSSRRDIYEEDDEEDEDMNGGLESASDGDDESLMESNSSQSDVSGSESSEEESEAGSEDERQAADLRDLLAQDQKTMVQDVIKTATDEAKKGKAVKKQLGIYDSLLDSRIKLQRGLQTTNVLADASTLDEQSGEIAVAETAAIELIEAIFTLREALAAQDADATQTQPRKRRHDSVESGELWRDIETVDAEMASWRDRTLQKWSQKTQAVSGLDKSKKFKALSQGILAQIEESKSDRVKLLKRTQIKRFKASSKTTVSAGDTSPKIYDDGDFYQEMLKDLIDSRMLDSANGNQLKWVATKQPKQKKATVDTRASKGRKLRFHVHEKMQNFMPPIPTGTWHEEQIDELFGSLFGQSMRVDEEVEVLEPRVAEVTVGDDFKLFG